jgi:hypothetical protein
MQKHEEVHTDQFEVGIQSSFYSESKNRTSYGHWWSLILNLGGWGVTAPQLSFFLEGSSRVGNFEGCLGMPHVGLNTAPPLLTACLNYLHYVLRKLTSISQ